MADPVQQVCWRCDFGSGQRGMDRCRTCDGTGSVFRVGTVWFPSTKEGYDNALALQLIADAAAQKRA